MVPHSYFDINQVSGRAPKYVHGTHKAESIVTNPCSEDFRLKNCVHKVLIWQMWASGNLDYTRLALWSHFRSFSVYSLVVFASQFSLKNV